MHYSVSGLDQRPASQAAAATGRPVGRPAGPFGPSARAWPAPPPQENERPFFDELESSANVTQLRGEAPTCSASSGTWATSRDKQRGKVHRQNSILGGVLAAPPLPHPAAAGPQQPDELARPPDQRLPHARQREVRAQGEAHPPQRLGLLRVPGGGQRRHLHLQAHLPGDRR
ncbi:unnamed protein product [Sphagnum tenellum]